MQIEVQGGSLMMTQSVQGGVTLPQCSPCLTAKFVTGDGTCVKTCQGASSLVKACGLLVLTPCCPDNTWQFLCCKLCCCVIIIIIMLLLLFFILFLCIFFLSSSFLLLSLFPPPFS